MKNRSLIILCLIFTLFILQNISAQSTFTNLNTDYLYIIDRLEIKSDSLLNIHTSCKPYERKYLVNEFQKQTIDSNIEISKQDNFNKQYILNDNWEFSNQNIISKKPFLKLFYKTPSALYNHNDNNFKIQINPIIQTVIGKEKNEIGYNYINTKGIEIRGIINEKIGFYSIITDNQIKFNNYVNNFINHYGAVPGEGFHKEFKLTAKDFITARGYLSLNATKNILIQFGHDKNFIGNGMRSLVLSDFSNSYLFLKLQTNIWKIKYTNLFAQMNNTDPLYATNSQSNILYDRKYFALHHLSINVTKRLNIGLFESIMFARASEQNGKYDLNYLNPIIFYRWVEQQNGSLDNANIGLDFKYNFKKHISIYGQLLIDELIIKEFIANKGSIRNKQGFQFGIKAIDILNINTLDLQLETNVVRPYTYSHSSNASNYTHYGQALAHPLGANFKEFIAILRYQPINRVQLMAKLIYVKLGLDANNATDSTGNMGGNIFKSYTKAPANQEFGNFIGQGIASNLIYLSTVATIMIKHNLFTDFEIIGRNFKNIYSNEKALIFNVGLRLNIAKRVHEF